MRNEQVDLLHRQAGLLHCLQRHFAHRASWRNDIPRCHSCDMGSSAPRVSSDGGYSVAAPGSVSRSPPDPSAPNTVASTPHGAGLALSTTAPAPSPKRTQVERSLQSTTRVSVSEPITSAVLYVPAAMPSAAMPSAYTKPEQPARRDQTRLPCAPPAHPEPDRQSPGTCSRASPSPR